MTARILSVASATPPLQADLALSTHHAERMSCRTEAQAGKVRKLYRRTGVETRGSVLLEKSDLGTVTQTFYPPLSNDPSGPTTARRNARFSSEAPALAWKASSDALRRSGVEPDRVTHLITVTCTGFHAPGIDVHLIDRLGLPITTERIQIGFMGCHALINALRTARGLVAAESDACVLICCVELCSLHYQYGYDAQRIVSGAIFADGAAGVIVVGSDFGTSGPAPPNPIAPTMGEIAATGSCLVPDSRDAMSWAIGDHGFEMTLDASVPGLIEKHLPAFLKAWLAKQGLAKQGLAKHGDTLDSIGGWAVHPGGVRILQSVETALGLDPTRLEISRDVLRKHGNMSSATLGVVLGEFQSQSIPRPWLMMGFGPGLEIEVALIR